MILKAIWPENLFHGMENETTIYMYVQNVLDKIHKDDRNHREISEDPFFTTSVVALIPLNKAARQIALRHGIHTETFLLAVASNINWKEHHWTRVGAEPQPEGINVIERHVGQKKWTEAATIRQSQEASGPDRGSAVFNTKGKGRGKSRGRGRGGALRGKGAAPAEAAGASQQNWGPITEEFRAAESKLQDAIEKLMPQIHNCNCTFRSQIGRAHV